MNSDCKKEDNLPEEFQKEWTNQIETAWMALDKTNYKKASREILNKEGRIVYKYVMSYDSFRLHLSYKMIRDAVIKALRIIKPEAKIVLDIGCGPYPAASFNLCRNNKVIFMDISKGYLEAARKIGVREAVGNTSFINSDIEELPFKDNSVDLMIVSEIIEHVSSCDKALKELRRVLKNNGIIVLTTPNRASLLRLLRILKDRMRHAAKPSHAYFVSPAHITEYSFFELQRIVREMFIIKTTIPVKYDKESSALIFIINILTRLPFLSRYSYFICAVLGKKN